MNTGTLTEAQRGALAKITAGLGSGKTKSYILRQPFNDLGELKETRLSTIF